MTYLKWQEEHREEISTHTLTWSVTLCVKGKEWSNMISTHTLTWSVTRVTELVRCEVWHFNSHAHVERDSTASSKIKAYKNFNTHAHVERDERHSQE